MKTLKEKIKIIGQSLKMFMSGECTDEMIDNTAAELGYINKANYLNVDDTCKYLKCTTDEFYTKIKPFYKLKPHRINNAPLGYYIHDLEKVKECRKILKR